MKTSKIKQAIFALLALILVQSCNNDDDNTVPLAAIPEVITISDAGLFPGKFDFNLKRNQFVVGSLTRSEVGLVNPQTGAYTTFVTDSNLALVTGIHSDHKNNRLLVASGDFNLSLNSVGLGQVAYLGIYNLTTGEKISGVNLKEVIPDAPFVFANEIAVDDNANIYITDSFSPVIYKVDGSTYQPSMFLDGGSAFENVPGGGGLALNGMVYVDGALVLAKTDSGELFRIPLNDPTNFVTINVPLYLGIDGLELKSDGSIVLVETGIGPHTGARILSSSDNWFSAQEIDSYTIPDGEFPTSSAVAYDGEVYILTSHLSKLTSGDVMHADYNIYRFE